METTLYNIAGYRFEDWSLVKELYLPVDASSSSKTLKDRSRDALETHLQYYAVPNGSLFIAFRAFVELSTIATIGIFGTSGRYLPQGAPDAWVIGGNYWYGGTWGTLVQHGGIVYECLLTHTGSQDKEPPNVTYWTTGSEWAAGWGNGKYYFMNQIITVEVSGVSGSYRCTVDHTSTPSTEPCETDWETVWTPGDEFIPNISISRQNLNISKGIVMPFGLELVGVFSGNTTGGRWIAAKASSGTIKAGATLYGIEVDE